MSIFFLIWQDPDDRRWLPVGRLERFEHGYTFVYTQGSMLSARFLPFGNMVAKEAVYLSNELFPLFSNRVLNERRPEYHRYASWSGMMDQGSPDPLLLMARMGGFRATDTLQVYPQPERTPDGMYHTLFFSHGGSHLPETTQHRLLALGAGDRLFPMLDVQNPFDRDAVALRTNDPAMLIGYAPRHLAPDFQSLSGVLGNSLRISVKQVNYDAPTQFRVLCEAIAPWPNNFKPCDGYEYQPISEYPSDYMADHLKRMKLDNPSRGKAAISR